MDTQWSWLESWIGEEKQRAVRKDRDKNKTKVKPLYFEETYDDTTGELIYLYKGGYFEDRQNKNFSKFIFKHYTFVFPKEIWFLSVNILFEFF